MQVSGYSEDDVDVLVDDFALVIDESIRRVLDRVTAELHPAVVASSSAGLGAQDISQLTVHWQDEVDGVLTPYVAEVYTGSATSVALGLAEGFPDADLPGVPLLADQYALTYIKTISNQFAGIGDDLWEDVRTEMLDGVAKGQSIEQISARIKAVANLTHSHATTVARTVVHAAAESGSIAQLRYVGYKDDEVTKEWVDSDDSRVRMTHRRADGQIVLLNEKFTVGVWSLDFPGDPSAPMDETIRCRCTSVFEVHEKPKFRCAGALLAASPPDATSCVVPMQPANISNFTTGMIQTLHNMFMAHKITPAWGGSKIHKVLQDVRADLKLTDPELEHAITDRQILAAVDHFYVAKKATFTEMYDAWAQSPAGIKVLGPVKAPVKGVIGPITVEPPLTPKLPTLPPVAGKPNPAKLKYTGKTLGSHGAQVWEDVETGDKWLFKAQPSFMTDLDVATARIQSKGLLTRPGVYKITLNGQSGSIQYMFHSEAGFPGGGFDPLKLSAADIAVLQREQIFDWMISNHDAHTAQFVRLPDGTLVGIDKGQAFKFFGQDELSWDYVPKGNIGTWIYQPMWKAYASGKKIDLHDPTTGELGEFIDHLVSIPDDTYRDILRPYALWRSKGDAAAAEKFLDAAVARKNNLKQDFATFWAKAQAERAKVVPPTVAPPTPPPPPVAAVTTLPGDAALGDISSFDYFFKQDIVEMWIAANGGKKVTPAWGGAKIWKLLEDVKKGLDDEWAKGGQPGSAPTMLQILRVLDEQGGFKGKPKTYESVLIEWLQTPAGKKVVGDVSLTAKPLVAPAVKAVKAVTTPSESLAEIDVAEKTLASGTKTTASGVFDDLSKYGAGEIIGYMKTDSGVLLRATKWEGFGADNPAVRVEFWSDTAKKWLADETFTDWYDLQTHYDAKAPLWSLVSPKKIAGKTKIPGKMPGDDISTSELWESKFLWQKDEEVAHATFVGFAGKIHQGRLVSDGAGGMYLEVKDLTTGEWSKIDFLHPDVSPPAVLNHYTWELSADALTPPTTPSVIPGFSAGDALTPDQLWDSAVPDFLHPTAAYAYSPGMNLIYRYRFGDTGWVIETRLPGDTKWKVIFVPESKKHLGQVSVGLKWRAATASGDIPPKLHTEIWGAPDAPKVAKVGSKYADFAAGDPLPPGLIPTHADLFNDYEIIAWAKANEGTLLEIEFRFYRITGSDGQSYFVRELRTPGDVWTFDELVKLDALKPTYVNDIKWFAPGDGPGHILASPSSVSTKAAKKAVSAKSKGVTTKKAAKKVAKKTPPATPPPPSKAVLTGTNTHIPGVNVGDAVTVESIMDNANKYVDGQVIAYGTYKSYGGFVEHYRTFVVDGKLVIQKQTKAGAWTGTEIVANKWSLKTWVKWEASNDHITPQHLKNASKAVAKHYAPPPPPAVKPSGPKVGPKAVSTPAPAIPFEMQHVDITPWTDAEQLEMYEFFRSQSIFTSSSPEQIWAAVQGLKSHFQVKYGGKYAAKLNEVEILRIIDLQSSKKHGVVDTHPFEAKVVNWLQTPAGKAWINKRIDAPLATAEIPAPMHDFASSTVDPDKQEYRIISKSEAKQYRDESHKKYGAFTAEQKAAQRSYTGGVYTAWNSAIRKGELGTYRASIIKAQAGMRPSTRPMLLHRGTSFAELNDPSISSYETLLPYVGRTYVNRGFNSTSVGGSAAFHGQLLIEYECPVGTPMSYVADFSLHPGENETTLPTHLVYRIISVTKKGATTVMRVRVIGVAEP